MKENALLERIFQNIHNQKWLEWIKLEHPRQVKYWKSWEESREGYDEGAEILFDKYGNDLPDECKYYLSIYPILVNPENGLVFGFQWGRGTHLIRVNPKLIDFTPGQSYKSAYTLDGPVDFNSLGANWALLQFFVEEEKEALEAAYAYSFRSLSI